MIRMLSEKIKWIILRRKWKKQNSHNHCFISKPFDISKVTIGKETYGLINPYFYHNPSEELIIGSFCSIGEGTKFIFSEHDYHRISTFPFYEFVVNEKEINPSKGKIVLEDDVWIGMDCKILSGVTIHQGAVVGAGSVVSKDIPPYAIFAGGRVVKYRFDEETIKKLLMIDYNRLEKEDVLANLDILYEGVSEKIFESDLYKKLSKKNED